MFDGELYASPRPAVPHARAAVALVAKLGGPFDFGRDPGGWLLLIEPELHFGNDVLVPDLAGWRRERLPSTPNEPYLTLAPDWVAEVVSPSTETIDRGRKLGIYAREGVRARLARRSIAPVARGVGPRIWTPRADRRIPRQLERARAAVRCHRARATSALELIPPSMSCTSGRERQASPDLQARPDQLACANTPAGGWRTTE